MHGDIELEYIFKAASTPSKILAVGFTGAGVGVLTVAGDRATFLQFLNSISMLFLRSNTEFSRSRKTYSAGEPDI